MQVTYIDFLRLQTGFHVYWLPQSRPASDGAHTEFHAASPHIQISRRRQLQRGTEILPRFCRRRVKGRACGRHWWRSGPLSPALREIENGDSSFFSVDRNVRKIRRNGLNGRCKSHRVSAQITNAALWKTSLKREGKKKKTLSDSNALSPGGLEAEQGSSLKCKLTEKSAGVDA